MSRNSFRNADWFMATSRMNRETPAKLHSLLRGKRGGLTSHYNFMLRFRRKQHGAAHSKVDVGHIKLGTQNIKLFFRYILFEAEKAVCLYTRIHVYIHVLYSTISVDLIYKENYAANLSINEKSQSFTDPSNSHWSTKSELFSLKFWMHPINRAVEYFYVNCSRQ